MKGGRCKGEGVRIVWMCGSMVVVGVRLTC